MTDPARTPKSEDKTRAIDDPMNVYHIDSDLDASIMVESCVLSPNSARKTRINAVLTHFHIIFLLIVLYYLR